MTLFELIERLEKADPATVVRNGFSTALQILSQFSMKKEGCGMLHREHR